MNIPEWAQESMMKTCPFCNSPIEHNEALTERWCTNPQCPEHMSYRITYIAKYYNQKGFGPAAAKSYYMGTHPNSPVAVIQTWFQEKPTETLSTIADLACIKDYGVTTGQKTLDKYGSFTEYFEKEPTPDPNLVAHKEELLIAETYFNVRKPFTGENIFVMATGVIHGYSNRDVFFSCINEAIGDRLHVIQTGARKTGVTCLIKEPDAVDHKKSRIAQECGIPILTSQEFLQVVFTAYERLGGSIEEAKRRLGC